MPKRKPSQRKRLVVDQELRRAAVAKKRSGSRHGSRQASIARQTVNRSVKSSLGWPTSLEGVVVDGRTYDVEVTYDSTGEGGGEARLHRLTIYERSPGMGIQFSDLSVPLRRITIEAVAQAASQGEVGVAVTDPRTGKTIGTEWGEGSRFAEANAAVRREMDRQRRTSWTPTVEQNFLTMYLGLLEAGVPKIHEHLAEVFGVSVSRSKSKLAELRKRLLTKGIDVPRAPVGRPTSTPDRRKG